MKNKNRTSSGLVRHGSAMVEMGFLKNKAFSKTITLPRESADSAQAYDSAIGRDNVETGIN